MKKLIASSLVAATMLATAAQADIKVGVGTDIIGGNNDVAGGSVPTLRVSIDGIVAGLRVEPRLNYMSYSDGATTATTGSQLTWGIAAYYDIINEVAVGLAYTTRGAPSVQVGTAAATVNGSIDSDVVVSLKAEKELAKNLSLSYELGLQFPSQTAVTAGVSATTSASAMMPYSAVSMRLWF